MHMMMVLFHPPADAISCSASIQYCCVAVHIGIHVDIAACPIFVLFIFIFHLALFCVLAVPFPFLLAWPVNFSFVEFGNGKLSCCNGGRKMNSCFESKTSEVKKCRAAAWLLVQQFAPKYAIVCCTTCYYQCDLHPGYCLKLFLSTRDTSHSLISLS